MKQQDVARIKAGLQLRINLGNYESAVVEAAVELPCEREEVEATFSLAWSQVEREAKEKVSEILQGSR